MRILIFLFRLGSSAGTACGSAMACLAVLLLGVGLWAIPEGARAQQVLEDIVVTARRREESLQDTPISITAYTATDIAARNLKYISEIAQSTPNLIFDNAVTISGSSASTSVFIRGVGQLDFTFNTDPGVGLYVDGVYLSRSIGSLVDLLDIERIEVLRGPQGTLFGRNTTGGAINITTKQPNLDTGEGKIGASFGDYDRVELYASGNLPVSETVGIRGAVSFRQRDGYVTRLQDGADLGDVDALNGRAQLKWLINESVELRIAVDGTRERQEALPVVLLDDIDETGLPFAQVFNGVTGPPCVPPPSPLNNPRCFNNQWRTGTDEFSTNATNESVSNLDLWGLSATLIWDVANFRFKSITSVRDYESMGSLDLDFSPHPIFDVDIAQELTAVTQEFQLLGQSFDDRLDWILGFFFLTEDARHFETIATSIGPLTSGGDTDNESIALFAQGTLAITDKLSLTAGIRWTDDTREFTPDSMLGPFLILPNDTFKATADEVTPLINLAYAWTESLNVYLTYSEGFKSGGFSQRVAQPNPAPPSFNPEFVEVMEAGLKLQAWDARLRLNASVFRSEYSDIQVLGQAPNVIGSSTINAGEAEIDGFELEVTALPVDGLVLQLGAGYLDAKYTALAPSVVTVTLDSSLPSAPEWTINASAAYDFHLANGITITPRLDWFYRSETNNVSGNFPLLEQDAYSLWNASVTLETGDSGWRIVLYGKNLSNETYLVSGDQTPAIGTVYGTYALPRTWAINVEKQF